jgi:hypothetical protein
MVSSYRAAATVTELPEAPRQSPVGLGRPGPTVVVEGEQLGRPQRKRIGKPTKWEPRAKRIAGVLSASLWRKSPCGRLGLLWSAASCRRLRSSATVEDDPEHATAKKILKGPRLGCCYSRSLAILVESPHVDSQIAVSVDFAMKALSRRGGNVLAAIRSSACLRCMSSSL